MNRATEEIELNGTFTPDEIIEEHAFAWETIGSNQELAAMRIRYLAGRRRNGVLSVALFVLAVIAIAFDAPTPVSVLLVFFSIVLFKLSWGLPRMDQTSIAKNQSKLRMMVMNLAMSDATRMSWFLGERRVLLSAAGCTTELAWYTGAASWYIMTALTESEQSFGLHYPGGITIIPKRWCEHGDVIDRVRSSIESWTGMGFERAQTKKLVEDLRPVFTEAFEKIAASAAHDHT